MGSLLNRTVGQLPQSGQWRATVYLALFIVLLCTIAIYVINNNSVKLGIIDLNEVYTSFELTKELDHEVELLGAKHNHILDSLTFELRRVELILKRQTDRKDSDVNEFNNLVYAYENLKTRYDKERDEVVNLYNSQVLKQIHSYVNEFCEKEKIDILFGSKGDGTIMYIKGKTRDYTNEAIQFINSKYHGRL